MVFGVRPTTRREGGGFRREANDKAMQTYAVISEGARGKGEDRGYRTPCGDRRCGGWGMEDGRRHSKACFST